MRPVLAAVIVNPHAGAIRRDAGLAARMRKLCGTRAELFITRDATHLVQVAEMLAHRQIQHVAVVGGDGTASATLTELCRAYGPATLPSVALLRGGTMNTVANSLGVSRRGPLLLLRRALGAWAAPGRARHSERPLMWVGDRLGFLFGTGVWYGWLAEYYDAGDGHPTPLTAVSVLARSLASALVDGDVFTRILSRQEISVQFEGGRWDPQTYISVCAGTVAHAGLGFQPFYRASEDAGCFHLLGIKGKGADLARDLPRIWLGRGMRGHTAYETTTGWAELVSREGRFGYSVDGDLLEADGRLSLKLGPAFSILRI